MKKKVDFCFTTVILSTFVLTGGAQLAPPAALSNEPNVESEEINHLFGDMYPIGLMRVPWKTAQRKPQRRYSLSASFIF